MRGPRSSFTGGRSYSNVPLKRNVAARKIQAMVRKPVARRRLNTIASNAPPSVKYNIINNPLVSMKDPKVYDGGVQCSHGRQFKSVFKIVVPGSGSATLLLYPGLSSGLSYLTSTSSSFLAALGTIGTIVTAAGSESTCGVVMHRPWADLTASTAALTIATDGVVTSTTKDVAKWRVVSIGAKITNIDSDQNHMSQVTLYIMSQVTPVQNVQGFYDGVSF